MIANRSALFFVLLVWMLSLPMIIRGQAPNEASSTPQEIAGKFGDLDRNPRAEPYLPEIRLAVAKARAIFSEVAAATRSAYGKTKCKPYLISDRVWATWYETHRPLIQELQRLMVEKGAFMVDYAPDDATWDEHTPATVYHSDPIGPFVLIRANDHLFFLDRNFPEMEYAGSNTEDSNEYAVVYTTLANRGKGVARILVSAMLPTGKATPYATILRVAFLINEPATDQLADVRKAQEFVREQYPQMQTLLPIECPPKTRS